MALHYVDSNASGLNDGTNWTNAYADLTTAIAGSVGTGDTIHVAHNHSKNYASATNLIFPANVRIISVNSGTDVYQKGAKESCTTGSFSMDGNLSLLTSSVSGMVIEATGGDITLDFANWYDCSLTSGGGQGRFNGAAGMTRKFKNCIISLTGTSIIVYLGNFDMVFDACEIITSTTATYGGLFLINTAAVRLIFNDCDLTGWTPNSQVLVDAYGKGGAFCEMNNCLMPSGASLYDSLEDEAGSRFIASAVGSADEYYDFFYWESDMGEVDVDTTTYLNATYDGSTGFSLQFSSLAGATTDQPFRCKIGEFAAQDLSTAQTVTVEVSSDASLTDNDIWIEVSTDDNTTEVLGVVQTTQNSDLLAAGTALTTTGTGTWTSGDTEDYIITLDIGAKASVLNGVVTVYGCIGKASIDANFDLPTIAAT